MPISIISAGDAAALNVMGEELIPLTPAGPGLGVQVFDTSAPRQQPGEAGPPSHRHPWQELYVVLRGVLEVFDGQQWRPAGAGACVTVPAGHWHSYRNGTADCRFLTITGPGGARAFFEEADATITTFPPDMDAALAVAARNAVNVQPLG
jgi:quercetin dioxygenase-like cupin family protein